MNYYDIYNRIAAYRCIKAGKTVAQIAHESGFSPSTIRRWIKEVNPK